jgi:hypothetical protein
MQEVSREDRVVGADSVRWLGFKVAVSCLRRLSGLDKGAHLRDLASGVGRMHLVGI